jgi:hypothetical protein
MQQIIDSFRTEIIAPLKAWKASEPKASRPANEPMTTEEMQAWFAWSAQPIVRSSGRLIAELIGLIEECRAASFELDHHLRERAVVTRIRRTK